jgi:DNA adenine methylase
VKIQGGKTRLVPFLRQNIDFDPATQRWVEPFLGAGAVLLNLVPQRALVGDTNPHIVGLYRSLQDNAIAPAQIAEHLRREGRLLSRRGEAHYYEVRERFNAVPSPSDFVFLNHTCFNGLLRFNRSGAFNSPFCGNPQRPTLSLIDDIAARLAYVQAASQDRDWRFEHQDWKVTLAEASEGDFVYADPPYAGRHTTYYSGWNERDACELAEALRALDCPWALSDWAADSKGCNPRLEHLYPGHRVVTQTHRYVIGAGGHTRGRMTEALVLSGPASEGSGGVLKPGTEDRSEVLAMTGGSGL